MNDNAEQVTDCLCSVKTQEVLEEELDSKKDDNKEEKKRG